MNMHDPQYCILRICRECRRLVMLGLVRRKSSTAVSKNRRGWFSTRQRDNYTLGTLYPPWWLPLVPGFLELQLPASCHCHSSMDLPCRVIDPTQSQIKKCQLRSKSGAQCFQSTLRNLYLELPNGTELTTLAAMHCLWV
jgi:hypothetical protein